MASKSKTIYVCSECGVESPKWIGKCYSCQAWNSFKEMKFSKKEFSSYKSDAISKPELLKNIPLKDYQRIDSKINELNRVLGGGIVPGSLILVGGEPGIGKSTLMLQMALKLELSVLYVSGEESDRQLKMRAERLKIENSECLVFAETKYEDILKAIETVKPSVIVLDSIQTIYSSQNESAPGSISQIKDCTINFLKFANQSGIPIFLIGHINKEGNIAGPKVLEHIVDVVLQFEGDQKNFFRIVRAIKNRFGSTSEIGVFEMGNKGLIEIENPSNSFLSKNEDELSGLSVALTVEGIRPFLIETQALVSSAVYGTPQRSAIGFDYKRMNMLLAVLEKRAGFRLAAKDVFLNITGGMKISDPGIDLAVICAILSSDQDISIPHDICFTGEVGLSGEIRAVDRIEQRVKEAEKLGFRQVYMPYYNKSSIKKTDFRIDICFVKKVSEVFEKIFA